MTQDVAQKIKTALRNEALYADLTNWMKAQLEDLKNIDNVRECSKAVDQAIELKASKKAYYQLQAILNTIIAVKNLPDPEPKEEVGSEVGLEHTDVEK